MKYGFKKEDVSNVLNKMLGGKDISLNEALNIVIDELANVSVEGMGLIPYTISDRGTFYMAMFVLPGIKKSSINVSISDKRLNVVVASINKAQSIKLTSNGVEVEESLVASELKDGILHVILPKKTEKRNVVVY